MKKLLVTLFISITFVSTVGCGGSINDKSISITDNKQITENIEKHKTWESENKEESTKNENCINSKKNESDGNDFKRSTTRSSENEVTRSDSNENIDKYDLTKAKDFSDKMTSIFDRSTEYTNKYTRSEITNRELAEKLDGIAEELEEVDIDFLLNTSYYSSIKDSMNKMTIGYRGMAEALRNNNSSNVTYYANYISSAINLFTTTVNQMTRDLQKW